MDGGVRGGGGREELLIRTMTYLDGHYKLGRTVECSTF